MSLSGQNLSLMLSHTPLFDGINLDVLPGNITTVLGPNGAGKTSLVRVLAGELNADSGSVSLNGKALKAWSPPARARTLAVLPQHSLLDFPFTVAEVVMLGRTPHDTGIAHDTQIVEQALKSVDGDYLAGRVYTQLSGGEKQRVHLARVLAQIWEPSPDGERYLILDEPTSSFDLAHQNLTLEVVRSLAEKGVGILMVIHDLNLAARCSDRMFLMQCGRIVISGTPSEVLKRETIASVFQVDATIGVHPLSGTPLVIT
jgi:iron complex transport system ATP-binding protein